MDIQSFIDKIPQNQKILGLEGKSSLFHFNFGAGGAFTVKVSNGEINVQHGLSGSPSCTIETTPEVFEKLAKGELNPMMAMMTRKIKISNPMELMQYAKQFGLA